MQTNVLYYGDNLPILREHISDESVDLVYLDPPFNSQENYNVIFRNRSAAGEETAQIHAFDDTWHWGAEAETILRYLTTSAEHGGTISQPVSRLMDALVGGAGRNDMTAYLVMMAPRLVELHRALRTTGSLWLHCDPTASHYLKLLLDAIFGPRNFVNEVIWRRSDAHNDFGQGAKHLGRVHDTLLLYRKSEAATFNPMYTPLPDTTVEKWYRHVEPESGRRYNLADITGPGGAAKGNPSYEFLGVTRYWRYSKERMQQLYEAGRIVQRKPGTVPAQKRYLDESRGVALQDMWSDIEMLRGLSKGERLGYPTQKPLALLERIIAISSNPGDVVLDPFCGCGTAIIAAQKLGRRWIGIDITHLAIAVMRARLRDAFAIERVPVVGEPVDLAGARALAEEDSGGRYQFQWWAVSLIDAQPAGGTKKKGADSGIDGVITFAERDGMKRVLVSVKSGHVNAAHIRDLRGTLEREKAAMGVLISLEDTTRPMKAEAVSAGFYHSDLWGKDFPRLQLVTIGELLTGKLPTLPPSASPGFERAQRFTRSEGQQQLLALAQEGDEDE